MSNLAGPTMLLLLLLVIFVTTLIFIFYELISELIVGLTQWTKYGRRKPKT